jgi:hypothetical protein
MNMAGNRPFVFIGSSAEGLGIAEAIQANLDYDCECQIWSQGLFGLSSGTLETLVKKVPEFDFAVFVLTGDDLTASRGKEQQSPRDNVVFELGLLIGQIGRERVFMVVNRTIETKLPTDLAGVTPATFAPPGSGNLQSALGAACTAIKQSIKQHGRRRQFDLGIEASYFIEDGNGAGVAIRLKNNDPKILPPFKIGLFHPEFGSMFFNTSEHTGALLPDQYREYRLPLKGRTAFSTFWQGISSLGRHAEASFIVVMEHSTRILYENKALGAALMPLAQKIVSTDSVRDIMFSPEFAAVQKAC